MDFSEAASRLPDSTKTNGGHTHTDTQDERRATSTFDFRFKTLGLGNGAWPYDEIRKSPAREVRYTVPEPDKC